MRIACIDGVIVPPERAAISVYDRGYLYGDGAFEVLRTYGGRAAWLDRHLARLARSAELLRMPPFDTRIVAADVARAIAAARAPDVYVRIMISRAEGKLGLMIDPSSRLTRVVLVEPLRPLPPELYERGARAITIRVTRQYATAKLLPYLTSILALDDARAAFADEAIFVDERGVALEGATSNFFIVRDGTLVTAPEDGSILPGVTRGLVVECAREAHVPIVQEPPSLEDVYKADEAFMTSSLREVVPIASVDDRPIAVPGPITRALHQALRVRTGAR